MESTDLRLVEIRNREGMGGQGIIGTIGVVVGASALLAVGYYIVTKFFGQVDTSTFSTSQNTTFEAIQGNSDDAFEISGFLIWVAVAVGVLTIVLGVMAVLGR